MESQRKIDGFDKWEVEEAARTLIRAQEIETRPKFFKVVQKELKRQADAANRAALEAKVNKRLKAL